MIWSTILVNTYYEDELKNSLKSTSMKLLVLASYAQFGVGAGKKVFWATVMAYDHRPNLPWRPILVGNYDIGLNLLCGE